MVSLSNHLIELVILSALVILFVLVLRARSRRISDLTRINKSLSEQLKNQSTEFRSEQGRMLAVLNSMEEGVMVTNRAGEIERVNPPLIQMLCLQGDCCGKTVLECIRDPDVHRVVQRVIGSGNPEEIEIEVLIVSDERFFAVHAAPLKEGDRVAGSVSVFFDTTRLRKLETMRKEFVANVSHELKTPLTNIRGYAETLRTMASSDPETAARFLEKIETNALYLQELVDDILRLSEMESGRFEPNIEPTDLAALCGVLFEEYRERGQRRNIGVACHVDSSLSVAPLDKKAFVLILDNLVDNAIRYTEPGGEVRVEALKKEGRFEVSVTDTGIGIGAEDLPRVFERFYRADKSRARGNGGTGLGLAIVKHLVQVLSGSIRAESEPGKGSRFVFSLPL